MRDRRGLATPVFVLTALVLSSLITAARAGEFNPNNPAASGYKLTFSDYFKKLDLSVWELDWWYDTPDACQAAYLAGTALASSDGLTLHIQSLETIPACVTASQTYSAAHLDTYGAFAQRLGYYEARLKSSGKGGTLTAFWLLPASGAWPPELDIEEIRGDYPDIAYMTNHYNADNQQSQYTFTAPANLSDAFHTYGALLRSDTIIWYIDGIERGQTPRKAGELLPLFPIFSLYTGNCGDGWAGCPSETTHWSADVKIAWVRAWQATSR